MTTVLQLPPEERPRERLLASGGDELSTAELLAIVLGSGTQKYPVVQLAAQLLAHFGNLANILNASVAELCQVPGIGQAKAVQLKATLALSRRLEASIDRLAPISTAKAAYAYLRPLLAYRDFECMMVLLLDVRNRPITVETVALGGLAQVEVEPRQIFHYALRHRAASLILAHNHPSGDPTPSLEDRQVTAELVDLGQRLDIPVNDHLVVTASGYVSTFTGHLFFDEPLARTSHK
ncbi:MAG: DNA repair protein RadC [Verrucomicrobia bacterium]|nr:DNA repair protein RadC [Verrucomicrobiota bacterium]